MYLSTSSHGITEPGVLVPEERAGMDYLGCES